MTTNEQSPGWRAASGLILRLALWLACLVAAPAVTGTLGPGAGLAAAIVASALWIVAGPRPLPGLLPGLMALSLLLINAGHAVHCAHALLR
ncbi:MAG: hypothetical protein H6711_31095 [Myxococcales bacterium]|nr:hypothetical protein [Myxococcales bacterium]